MSKLVVACPVTWDAAKACHAWGGPGPHGCKKLPGHSGEHRCPCGSKHVDKPLSKAHGGC